jgi:hypothetical protein
MYLPPQFIASAVFLALGVKLVWAEACELADAERRQVPVARVSREEYDLVAADDAARLPSPASREIARRTVRDAAPARRNGE